MNMKKLILSLYVCAATMTFAQSTGKVSYTMEFSSDNPEMAMAIGMMQGSTMDLSFVPGKTRLDMNMGSFMKMSTIADQKKDKSLMLMDAMGQKIATESSISKAAEEEGTKPKVETTSETKEIIGYKCVKTIIKGEDGTETIMWTTKDISASLVGQKQFGATGIEGFPLEFSTVSNGMNIHFVANKYDKAFDKKGFKLTIPDGYSQMSEDELKNMGGGM